MTTYIKSDKELIAESAVKSYLQVKNNPHTNIQLQLAENKMFLALDYLADRYTKKFFFDSNRPDLKQSFYECVVKALETYDASKSDFTYWLDLHTMKMFREGNKITTYNKKSLPVDYAYSIPDPQFSPEKLCIIKQSIEQLCKSDYELLMIWLDSDSFEDAAWKLNVSKQAVHSRVQRIIEKFR